MREREKERVRERERERIMKRVCRVRGVVNWRVTALVTATWRLRPSRQASNYRSACTRATHVSCRLLCFTKIRQRRYLYHWETIPAVCSVLIFHEIIYPRFSSLFTFFFLYSYNNSWNKDVCLWYLAFFHFVIFLIDRRKMPLEEISSWKFFGLSLEKFVLSKLKYLKFS